MTTYQWTNHDGNSQFGDAGNWIDESTGLPGASPPGAADTVDLEGAGSITGTGTIATLNVSASTGQGFLLANGSVSATTVNVGGVLTLDGGEVLAASVFNVDGSGSEVAAIISRATLTGLAGSLALTVSGPSQYGLLYLSSEGSIALGSGSIVVGTGASQFGSLMLAGNIIGGASSTMTIGAQSALGMVQTNGGTLSIGESIIVGDNGTGVLRLSSTVIAGDGTDPALIMGVGTSSSSFDLGYVTATDAQVTLDGQAQIGVSATGSFVLSNSTLTTEKGLVAGLGGALGTMSMQNSSWIDTGNVVLGAEGFGVVSLTGGAATIDGDVLLGEASANNTLTRGGLGTLSVSGASVKVEGLTQFGLVSAGSNAISVSSDGTWDSTGQTIDLGNPFGGNGSSVSSSLSVLGAGSVLDAGALLGGTNTYVDIDSFGARHCGDRRLAWGASFERHAFGAGNRDGVAGDEIRQCGRAKQ
jgi:hypothetical protein